MLFAQIKYEQFLNSSIGPIDENLQDTTTPGQSGHGSNSSEGVFHISQVSRIRASSLNAV